MSEQRFSTPHPVAVEVKLASGDIHVATSDADESTVTLEGSAKLVETVRVELVGDRLIIQQRRKARTGIFERFDGPLSVSVIVPHRSRIEAITAASDSTLEGTFAGLKVKSASGDLLVTGKIEGDANVETVSGSVRLPHVGGAVTARSVSGELAIDSVEGTMFARSVSGDIGVGSVRQGTATVQSVSGEVDLGIAAGTNIDLDAASASGELTSEIPLSPAPVADGGPTVIVRGRTVSGDFRVFRAA